MHPGVIYVFPFMQLKQWELGEILPRWRRVDSLVERYAGRNGRKRSYQFIG